MFLLRPTVTCFMFLKSAKGWSTASRPVLIRVIEGDRQADQLIDQSILTEIHGQSTLASWTTFRLLHFSMGHWPWIWSAAWLDCKRRPKKRTLPVLCTTDNQVWLLMVPEKIFWLGGSWCDVLLPPSQNFNFQSFLPSPRTHQPKGLVSFFFSIRYSVEWKKIMAIELGWMHNFFVCGLGDEDGKWWRI